ncbi:mRNA guanylyltransferase [Kwoniella heveanensis CBS 569]|nr:mRNA guanylyltransferase [Kwoniella heveanensis CBS 569]
MPHTPIPQIPGTLLDNPEIQRFLAQRVAGLCGLNSPKFPGSQPVSFTSRSLDLLESMNFWVCEKSDGVRVLVFIVMNAMSGNQEVWLIDRKERYFAMQDLHFPHWENIDNPLGETILDGELVIDVDPKTGAETLRFYAFDCLVLNGENIMKKPLLSRYGRLRDWVIKPFEQSLSKYPEWRDALPFQVVAKEQELSYHLGHVLKVHIPKLQHGHDGLIFTCVESEYVPGTDEKILKWKPPSENSIDFKLELRFPPSPHNPSEPDYYAKPEFLLHTWLGGDQHEFYDHMGMEDDEWEKFKESGEQLDDQVVEVCWDTERGYWRMMRIRDDKNNANHKSIMQKILISIEDGVEIEALLSRTDAIRTAWKAREQAKRSGTAPSSSGAAQRRPPPQQQGGQTQPPTPGGARGSMGYPNTPGGGGGGQGYGQHQGQGYGGMGVVAGLKR